MSDHLLDAMGNPIVLGKLYGTVSKYDGNHTTVVGIAENITESGNITLHITRRMCAEGGVMVDRTQTHTWRRAKPKRTVSHPSVFLFPVASI
jgi:hypothetical protein